MASRSQRRMSSGKQWLPIASASNSTPEADMLNRHSLLVMLSAMLGAMFFAWVFFDKASFLDHGWFVVVCLSVVLTPIVSLFGKPDG